MRIKVKLKHNKTKFTYKYLMVRRYWEGNFYRVKLFLFPIFYVSFQFPPHPLICFKLPQIDRL